MGLMLYEGEKGEIYVSSMEMFAKVMKNDFGGHGGITFQVDQNR